MLVALLLAQAAPPAGRCDYDRPAMLALAPDAFDQDLKGGWRKLGDAGCYLAAADLLRDYRSAHSGAFGTMAWHEGQMRAFAGQDDRAASLFDQSRRAGADPWGWNLYVDGSIAFLRHDRAALDAARAKLAALPRPANFSAEQRLPTGDLFKVSWPPTCRCWTPCSTASTKATPRPMPAQSADLIGKPARDRGEARRPLCAKLVQAPSFARRQHRPSTSSGRTEPV